MANARSTKVDLWDDTQTLLKEIYDLVQFNSPENPNNFYPHVLSDLNIRSMDLGYDNVLHFCFCNPEWFDVQDIDTALIYINRGEKILVDQCDENKRTIIQETKAGPSSTIVHKPNIDDATQALLANYNTLPPSMQCSVVKGEMQSIEPTKKGDCIHFKFAHQGKTRRFTFPRGESDLIGSVKQRVHLITGATKTFLYWNDEESLVVLECNDDMCAAIDFAERRNRPPCIVIEATVEEEEKIKEPLKEENEKEDVLTPVIATREESRIAFNDFAFMCDSCDAFLAPSNGGRYKCVVCDNYDLCASCVAKGVHDNHALILLMNGETIVPLSDGKGGVSKVQVMDTPRCTPSFVVLQNYDKPGKLLEIPKTTWDKVMVTMEKQKASYEKQREQRLAEEREKQKEVDPVQVLQKSNDAEAFPLRTMEQIRREQNLQNAIKNPFDKMRDEDREAWKILEKERELTEKAFMRARVMREEEIEESRRIDEEMKKLAVREEIIRLEMEQMKIEKALMELRMKQEKEPTVEEAKAKENQAKNVEHNELWSVYEAWKEKVNEEKREKESRIAASKNEEKIVAEEAKEEIVKEDKTVQQKELTTFSSDGSDLEIIDMLAMESGTVLETMKVLENKFGQLLLQPVTESAAPAAEYLSLTVEDAVAAPPEPSPDYEILEMTAADVASVSEEQPADDSMPGSVTSVGQPCSCSKETKKEEWPSERWKAFAGYSKNDGEQEDGITQKFLEDRDEFLGRLDEIELIPAHLERLLLWEMPENTDIPLKNLIARYYNQVTNNIRMHVYIVHEKVLTERRDVENEMVRLIATDLSKRLMAIMVKVGHAKPGERMRLIWDRIRELDQQIADDSTKYLDCRFAAMQLHPILCNSTYTINYKPNEAGFEQMPALAQNFIVELNVQADNRIEEMEIDQVEEEKEKPIELNECQQDLLSQLLDTDIFDDYDKMVEICRRASNLEEAIDLMLNGFP